MTTAETRPDSDFGALFAQDRRPPCQLYLISPAAADLAAHAAALAEALDAGGPVAAYQLRLKGADDSEILRAAEILLPICAAHDIAFILNDRMDLAKGCGADGVHLGQSDGSPIAARALLGPDAQIGVTCHASRHLAMEAGEAGANYVAFGTFFPTTTKQAEHVAGPEILGWWTALSPIPCVAIGGITAENCPPLVRAGADFLAASAAVWNNPAGPAAAIRQFAAHIASSQR